MAAPLVIECLCGEVLATEIHLLLKGEIGHGVTESQRKDRSELIRNADPLQLVFFISRIHLEVQQHHGSQGSRAVARQPWALRLNRFAVKTRSIPIAVALSS